LTAYLLSNISARNYKKLVDVRRSYSKPKQCRFLRHSVYTYLCIHTRIATQVLRTVFKVYVKFNVQFTKRY